MSKKISIKDKVVLVSGANRGIGRAIAVEMLENGAKKVYAGARKVDSLKDLGEKYGERLVPVDLDVTKDETIASVSKAASDVEILVNNAGILEMGNFHSGDLLGSLKNNMDVNVFGVVKLIKALLPALKEKESGAIVTVSSAVAFGNMPMGLTYSATKAAVHSIIQGLRAELRDSNILVAGVYPGPIDTDMTKGFEMDKASPKTVAQNTVAGIESGEEYILPDPMSKQMGEGYFKSPKATEKEFANFL